MDPVRQAFSDLYPIEEEQEMNSSLCLCESCQRAIQSLQVAHEGTSDLATRCQHIEQQILGLNERYFSANRSSIPGLLSQRISQEIAACRSQIERRGSIEEDDFLFLCKLQKYFHITLASAFLLGQQERVLSHMPLCFSDGFPPIEREVITLNEEIQKWKVQSVAIPFFSWGNSLLTMYDSYVRFLQTHACFFRDKIKGILDAVDADDRERLRVFNDMAACIVDTSVLDHVTTAWQGIIDMLAQKARILPIRIQSPLSIVLDETNSKKNRAKNFTCTGFIRLLGLGTYKLVSKVALERLLPSTKPVRFYAFSQFIRFEKDKEADFIREAFISRILREKGVPYILKVKKAVYSREDRFQNVGLLSEFCTEGSLDDFLSHSTSLHERLILALQLCTAVQAMHEAGFCHLDLKTTNILLTNVEDTLEVRIADLASVCEEGQVTDHCSTFAAPEMILEDNEFIEAKKSMDLWALGEILCVLKYGRTWLLGKGRISRTPLHEFIQKTKASSLLMQGFMPQPLDEVDHGISLLFSFEPEKRPLAGHLVEVIQGWLTQHS